MTEDDIISMYRNVSSENTRYYQSHVYDNWYIFRGNIVDLKRAIEAWERTRPKYLMFDHGGVLDGALIEQENITAQDLVLQRNEFGYHQVLKNGVEIVKIINKLVYKHGYQVAFHSANNSSDQLKLFNQIKKACLSNYGDSLDFPRVVGMVATTEDDYLNAGDYYPQISKAEFYAPSIIYIPSYNNSTDPSHSGKAPHRRALERLLDIPVSERGSHIVFDDGQPIVEKAKEEGYQAYLIEKGTSLLQALETVLAQVESKEQQNASEIISGNKSFSSETSKNKVLYSRILAQRPMVKINGNVQYLSSGTSMSHAGGKVVGLFENTWMRACGVASLEKDGSRKINKMGNIDLLRDVDEERGLFDLAVTKTIRTAIPEFNQVSLNSFYEELMKITGEDESMVRRGICSSLGKIAVEDLLLSGALSKISPFFTKTTVGKVIRQKGIEKYGIIEICEALDLDGKPIIIDYPEYSDPEFANLTDAHLPNNNLEKEQLQALKKNINLAILGKAEVLNAKNEMPVYTKNSYLGWMNIHTSGYRGITRFSHWYHGDSGINRARNLLEIANNPNVTYEEILTKLKQTFMESSSHKHSLSRYLVAQFNRTNQSFFDLEQLTDNEFEEQKSNFSFN